MNKKLLAAVPAFMLAVPTVLAQPRQETNMQTILLDIMRTRQAQLLEAQKVCDQLKPLAATFAECGVKFELRPDLSHNGSPQCDMIDQQSNFTIIDAGQPVKDAAKDAMTPKRIELLVKTCPQQYSLSPLR